MKISESWLREWVNPPLTTAALSSQLTMAGLEVETVTPVAGMFTHVIVAKVTQTKPHPQADRLTVCDVDAGSGTVLQIVCGAANVRAGLKVALAMIGAHLPGDFVIKETKLRGELSQGMLCSASELGLAEQSEGILELADDAPIGINFREYLALDDHVFDLDLTPNRADCLSVLGVARDLGALNNLPVKPIASDRIAVNSDQQLQIHLHEPQACPKYAGRVITGINSEASTPLWMKERLRRADLRATHPVVDVLNYVMLELGQPMHAFDLNRITGNIHVRKANADEMLQLLGGQTVTLTNNVLVIADDKNALAMAGIMGGDHSAVHNETQAIWLESAYFNPLAIAGIARQFGLSSDASHRYERGVDPELGVPALERAAALLHSIVGGTVGPIVETIDSAYFPAPKTIAFDPRQVMRLTGMPVPEAQMLTIFTHLGLQVAAQNIPWQVHVPSYRFDLQAGVDLVEEVIRIVGYDNIPMQSETMTMQAGTIDPLEQITTAITQFLAHRGYQETISYSFVDPQLQQPMYPDLSSKMLLNPISAELSAMRVGLWPGLIAAMLHNIHRQHAALKLCETGKIFLLNEGQVEEKLACAGLIVGTHGQYNWTEVDSTYDFYDMKGDLEALFATLQRKDIRFIPDEHTALHPGKTAKILCDGQDIGWIGALHPRLVDNLDLDAEVIVFEFMVSAFIQQPSIVYQSISKYPQIRRDLSLLLDEHVHATELESVIRSVLDPKTLKAFYIFDVYTGGGLAAEHKKSVALGLVLQSDERTLIDAEIHAMISAVVTALETQVGAVLRATDSVDIASDAKQPSDSE